MRKIFICYFSLHRPSLYQSLVMGASARTCACLILHPFTVLKTRLEVCKNQGSRRSVSVCSIFQSGKFRYKSVPGGIKLVIKAEGLPGKNISRECNSYSYCYRLICWLGSNDGERRSLFCFIFNVL